MSVQPKSVVGFFCEDIRVERSGAITVIGIMPDNANVSAPPTKDAVGVFPKLCVYARIHFDVTDTVKSVSMTMRLPDGNSVDISTVEPRIITKAFESAKEKGFPLANIIMRAAFMQFPIVAFGQLLVDITVDDEKYIAAQLNLVQTNEVLPASEDEKEGRVNLKITRKVKAQATSSSEPQQPS